MIETKRLRIYPASQTQMEEAVAAEHDPELKAAYVQMLDGCLRHPRRRRGAVRLGNGVERGGLGRLAQAGERVRRRGSQVHGGGRREVPELYPNRPAEKGLNVRV